MSHFRARLGFFGCTKGVFVLCIGLAFGLFAQNGNAQGTAPVKTLKDTIPASPATNDKEEPSFSFNYDSLQASGQLMSSGDSVRRDSMLTANDPLNQVSISDDALDDEVIYSARDTKIYDIMNETVYLYGEAKVDYTDLNLQAGKITFNWAKNEVIAEPLRDSSGELSQYPIFKDKTQNFEAKYIRYNVKTRKGIVRNVITKQGADLYVVGEKAKFISTVSDSGATENVVYSEDAIFTTCNHPEPHFGIRSQKQKVVPNKVVVVGPSNLEIMGVATPLWLPFGFYPITDQGSTGLIFPRDYENSDRLGFGFRDVGWFFPLNDYMNLQLTGDIYLRGTWGAKALLDYRRKYKYNGAFSISYRSTAGEDEFAFPTRSNAMNIQWSHRQDPKANPIHNFSASVNIATNNFIGQVETAAPLVLDNRLTSSINYSRKFPGKRLNFTASFNHSQNRRDSTVNFTLPNLLFTTGNFQPFKSKGSKKKWYENFNFSYRAEAKSNFTTKDTELFTSATLESANPGMRQQVTGSFNARVFKYFNYSINSSYSENWYLKSTLKEFDSNLELDTVYTEGPDSVLLRVDTLTYGSVNESSVYGYKAFHNLKNTTMSLGTKLFSTVLLKKGKLRGLRHVMTPSFGFGFNPGQSQFFNNTVDTDVRPDRNNPLEYSIFEDVIYDKPTNREEQLNFTYSFGNTIEAKLYNKKEKETKNVKILESLTFGGNYNFRADSLKWSDPSLSARTTFFKKLISVQYRAGLSFYVKDSLLNKRVDKLLIKEKKGLIRIDNARLNINTGISVKQVMSMIRGEDSKKKPTPGGLEELLDNFRLNYNLAMNWTSPNAVDTFNLTTHTLDLRGKLKLTENWDIQLTRIGYDLINKKLTYPDLTFNRNLHCWQMSVSWRPVQNYFSFTLGVRPGTLEFIKVPYKRNLQDGSFQRR